MTSKQNLARTGFRSKKYFIGAVAILGVSYVYFAGSVDKTLTRADIDAISKLSVNDVCANLSAFQQQIDCIRAIQTSIRTLVPNFKCAAKGTTIEPLQFIERGFGCCYDRARFTEKALSHFGFQTRHVAIYERDERGLLGLLIPQTGSHATTEVKTLKGWMGVDSNQPFILITTDDNVLTYRDFKKYLPKLKYAVAPAGFYKKNLIVIYGLFSRHGMFHGPNLPTPEFNLRELLYNAISS
jgi:hypothetical protein